MSLDKLKAFFAQIFTELNNEESWIILLFLGVSFLIGLFFGWLSRGRKIRRMKRELKAKDKELILLRAENGSFKEQLELKEEALQKIQQELAETQGRTRQLEEENSHLNSDLENSQRVASSISAENASNLESIDELHKVIADLQYKLAELQNKNDELTALTDRGNFNTDDVEHLHDTFELTTNRINALEVKLSRLENENQNLRNELGGTSERGIGHSNTYSDAGLGAIKTRLEQLEKENNRLQKSLDGLHLQSENVLPPTSPPTDEISVEERTAIARSALNAAIGSRIKAASAEEKNDLKKINGIGPFIEKKLNDIGIFTYEQISQFDADIIHQITDAIQFFPGRIDRDDWVGQAKKLIG